MAEPFRIAMDTSAFDEAIVELSRLTGKSFKTVLLSECASILGASIKRTKPSTAAVVNAHYAYKDGQPNKKTIPWVYLNGVKTRVRSVKRKGMLMPNGKWNPKRLNPQWKLVQDELKRLLAIARSRKGLSKATFLDIAVQLKIKGKLKPPFPDYAVKAHAGFTQKIKQTLSGKSREMGEEFVIEVRNTSRAAMSPKSKKGAGGFDAFRKSFNGRTSYFEENVSRGVFNKAKNITKRYPGLDCVEG
tara:strand:- start:709 stop:1443 length:735 start_codon:yes stop_codon:yes gene_type:complete